MTTPNMIRCKKCSLCNCCEKFKKWVCEECGKNVDDIKDEDCPLNQDY